MQPTERPGHIEPAKVPEATAGFWAIKIVATTLGEVGGNAVTLTLGLGSRLVRFQIPLRRFDRLRS